MTHDELLSVTVVILLLLFYMLMPTSIMGWFNWSPYWLDYNYSEWHVLTAYC